MAEKKTLTFVLMDPPYETARSTTALRLVDIAVRRGHHVNVFAYEARSRSASPGRPRTPTPCTGATWRRRTTRTPRTGWPPS